MYARPATTSYWPPRAGSRPAADRTTSGRRARIAAQTRRSAARDQIETKELAEFARLRAHVYRLIKREQEEAGTGPGDRGGPLTAIPGGQDVIQEEDRSLPETADRTRRG